MRRRYIQHPVTHELIPAEEYVPPEREPRYYIQADIAPYQSMATGEWITSRSKHREHLKAHGLTEVGNEINYMTRPRAPVRPDRERRRREIAHVINHLKG